MVDGQLDFLKCQLTRLKLAEQTAARGHSGNASSAVIVPKELPTSAPIKSGGHTLVIDPIVDFVYLTIERDRRTVNATLQTSDASGVKVRDSVTVDVKSGRIVNPAGPGATGDAAVAAKRRGPPVKHRS